MSTEKRITDPNAGRDSDEARRNLSEHALSERTTGGRERDRVSRVGDGQTSFRDQASEALRSIRGDLKNASTDMTNLNKDVESGKVQIGSQAWKERMQACEQKYDVAIQNADKILTPEVQQRIKQEQQALEQQAQIVDAARKAGRALTPEEMQKCGLKTNDPARAMEQLQQAAMTLEDLSRESGYTRANKGLAEIRAAAGLPDAERQAQVQKGQQLLQEAGAKDAKMFGPPPDPNFEKHLKTVVKLTTGQDISLGADSQQVPGGDGKNAQMSQDGKFVKDGAYTLPTGQNASDGANFQNPFKILKAVDESLSSPMSKDNINGYQAAIQAADTIDRGRLVQKMAAERDYIDKVLAGPNGDRINSILKQMDTANVDMEKQHQQMAQWIPDLMKGPNGQQNPEAVATLQKLQNLQTVQDINNFMRDPKNAAEVQKFQGLPHGAEFISTLQQFRNNQAIVKQGEAEIAKYDPNFAKAQQDLQSDMALYHSSEDTRAHLVRSLVRDPANQTPENIALAQKTMQELAAINKNVLQDPEFQQMAGMLGMRPDGKGGIEVARAGDQTTTGGGSADKINDNVIKAFQTSIAAYGSVKDGTPLTAEQKAAFEAGIAATKGITAADVQAARGKALEWAKSQGWNDQLETQFQGLNKDLSDKFAKIDPAKQQQINEIQTKIGNLPPNDATAQQQRQNLETQLQGMGSDANVKAWLDSRVALAQFYTKPENQQAVAARLQVEQMNQTFQGLEHGTALTEGLYGAALVRTGDKQGARPHLVEAARDPVALQMVPDIAQAIQATGDQTIATEAQQKGPLDKGAEVAPVTGGPTNAAAFDLAVQSLGQAQEALTKVQQNGQPLPAELDAVFQNAIKNTGAIDKASLDAMGKQIEQNLLAGWDQQKEAAYRKLATDVQQAQAQISQDGQKKLNELATSIPQNDPQGQQKFDAGLRQLATTDPTIANYVKALDTARTAHQDPAVQNRDKYEAATQQLAQLAHGKGIAQTLYAAALAQTGNPADAAKAKTVMAEALKDGELAKAFPPAAEIATKLGLGAQQVDPELAKIPGFTQLMQAEQIMQDQTLTPQQRIEKAGPLYDQAVQESKKINIAKLDQDIAAIGTKLEPLMGEWAKVKDDQAKAQQFLTAHPEFQTLNNDAEKLTNMRLQPMKARLLEGMAYNAAADALYKQAAQDPAKKADLTRVADDWNKKAATVLGTLQQDDPKMWQKNPTIQGAIQQANEHKLINTGSANAIGQVINTSKMVDFGVNGPIKGFQPLWMSMNIAGDALQLPGKIPVPGVSTALQIFPGSLGAGLSRTAEIRPGAAFALAAAKDKDGKAADDMVGNFQHQLANTAVYTGGDLLSGYAGVAMGKFVVDMAGSRLGPVGKFVTFAGVGLATTTASNKAVDFTASKMFGTDQRDNAELLSHSAASFGMTWGLQGLSNYRANAQANFLNGAEMAGTKPSFLNSMAVWNDQAAVTNMTKFRFMSGVDSQVPMAFKENYLALSAQGKSAVGTALQSKFTAAEFAALNPTQQYSALQAAYKTATAETAAGLAGGSKFMSRLPFSGNYAAARESLGTIENPWMFSGKGRFAYNFASGAAGMGVYGLGEVNPFLTNKATGEKYTFGDMVSHSATNMAWGGFGSAVAAPLVGKAMDFAVRKPLQFGVNALGKPVGWLFDAEANAATRTAWTGLGQVERKSMSQLGSTFTGNWTLTGEGALAAARNRFLVTGGVGSGAGFITHNPWMTNPETGKNYTWGESATYAGKWGLYTGAAGVAAPYVLFGGKAIVEGGKGAYNWSAPYANKALVPAAEWAAPAVNSGRAFAGRQADRVLKPLGNAWEQGSTAVGNSRAASVARNEWSKYYNTMYAPTIMLEGQAVGAAYGYYEWGRINDEANAILKAAREKQAAPAGAR